MLRRPDECRGCALDDKALGFSLPEGSGTLGVLILGEALGENEAREAKPFRPYAQAGSLLERVIKMCGFDRQQFRLFNMVNCFIGSTAFSAPDIKHAYRRWYSGPMVTLETSDGILTGTPNHPTLTLRGWIPLGEIQQGDYLVRCVFIERVFGGNPYINRMPAPAFEVFNAFAAYGVRERMIGSNMDFHGDGIDTDIEIVSPDGLLWDNFNSQISQHRNELILKTADHAICDMTKFGSGNRSASALLETALPAFYSDMSCVRNLPPLFLRHGSHTQPITLSDTTQFNALLNQHFADCFDVRAELFRQLLHRHSRTIEFAKVNDVTHEPLFEGHVYNLSTQSELYTANGYVVHNCRPPRDFLKGAPWELGAVNHCAVHRNRVVQEMRPKVILGLGGIPLQYLTGHAGKKRGITYMRGYVHSALDYECPIICSYHPSFLQRGKKNLINVLAHDIRKAVAIAQGKFTNYCLYPDREASRYVTYITNPSPQDAESYYLRCKDNPNAWIYFDIETGQSRFVDEDDDEKIDMEVSAGAIEQIQFSIGIGEAIAMPWDEAFKPIAQKILDLPNVKAAHNGWRFDLPVLKREHTHVRGIIHDTRWMWHHLQPDLPAELQFVSSFYGMPFAWKHLDAYDPEFYGCADVDSLARITHSLPSQMQSKGVWQAYERHVRGLEPILLNMTRRGVPVDDERRLELGKQIAADRQRAKNEVQQFWPPELVKFHPEHGYQRPPRDLMYHDHPIGKEECNDNCAKLIQVDFTALLRDPRQEQMFGNEPIIRWAHKMPYNPGSSQQLIEYLKHVGIPVPKKHKEDKETTEEVELLKLINRYKVKGNKYQPIVRLMELTLEYRESDKMYGTYVLGWAPDTQGFVHPKFHYGTAVGQLASKDPNGQNFPKRSNLAKTMRYMIRAKPGHKIVDVDFSSFHAVTLAFEAQSRNWMRLARSDIHSFTTAHFLKLPERDKLLDMPDDELKAYLAWVKENHSVTRDNKAKHAILGVGNGLGYRKLYRQNSDFFDGEKEAKTLLDTIRGVFPEVFLYQDARRREAHAKTYLISKFGYIRWFFDVLHWDSKSQSMVPGDDSEAALSYHHVNDAFGHKKEQMLWLRANGYDERWGYFNDIHDSYMFHCKDELVEECAFLCHQQMTKRSPILIDPVTAPDGLWVDVEIKVGENWKEMQEIKLGKPVGLQPGDAGLQKLWPIQQEWDDSLPELPELARYATVLDADIPF